MSWRRFRILFEGIFTWNDEPISETYEPGAGSLAKTVDWGGAEHKRVPDILGGIQTTQLFVGRDS